LKSLLHVLAHTATAANITTKLSTTTTTTTTAAAAAAAAAANANANILMTGFSSCCSTSDVEDADDSHKNIHSSVLLF